MTDGPHESVARMIGPSLVLQAKARGVVRFDEEALKRVEQAYAKFVSENKSWVQVQVSAIADTFTGMTADGRPASLEDSRRLFEQTHTLRGLGTTFGYPLLTAVADSLCRWVEGRALTVAELRIVRLHVDMLLLVVMQEMGGDGGDLGRGLLTDLARAVAEASATR